MSETPQGPGWWLASDGRYYPPESAPGPAYPPSTPQYPQRQGFPEPTTGPRQEYPRQPYGQPYQEGVPSAQARPSYQAPQPYQVPPGYPQGPTYPSGPGPSAPGGGYPSAGGPPQRRRRGRGCLVTAVVVVAVVAGLVVGGRILVDRVTGWFGAKTDSLVGGSGCPFLSDGEAAALVGGKITLVKAGSLTSVVSQMVDGRVIPDAPSCWAMSDSRSSSADPGRLMRIASQTSPDAAKSFRDEVTKAKGVTVDKGSGLSVSSERYYNKPVTGFGDEAFCTTASTSGPGSAGVLVRKGDRLVYVSLTPDLSQGAPGIGTPGRTTLSTDDGSCALAQKIAAVVLTH
ncbi:MAG TPA: hypothetical protein VFP72_00055 [Kineosporiaceae bacterium]|nr:hypothetical protein [Kineosporiaceae bacterium]